LTPRQTWPSKSTSRPGISKLPIYEAIGIPELWRHDGKKLHFYGLAEKRYSEIAYSNLFPFLKPDIILRFLRKGEADGTVAMARAFRTCVRRSKDKRKK
jgi:hypothetical protein